MVVGWRRLRGTDGPDGWLPNRPSELVVVTGKDDNVDGSVPSSVEAAVVVGKDVNRPAEASICNPESSVARLVVVELGSRCSVECGMDSDFVSSFMVRKCL
mmetsp:Transcript_7348/g.16235  ORF Transcript_7348/g.16235 Transcript_7348/m.16235 type:complete len:101 (-) Transcript_7348:86-388(-)